MYTASRTRFTYISCICYFDTISSIPRGELLVPCAVSRVSPPSPVFDLHLSGVQVAPTPGSIRTGILALVPSEIISTHTSSSHRMFLPGADEILTNVSRLIPVAGQTRDATFYLVMSGVRP